MVNISGIGIAQIVMRRERDKYPEYSEEAVKIMDTYIKEYKVDLDHYGYEDIIAEKWIRHWLRAKEMWEGIEGQVSQHLEDWYMKYLLKIEPYNEKYVKAIDTILYHKPGANRTRQFDYHIHESTDTEN